MAKRRAKTLSQTSVLSELQKILPHLRPQVYFKSSLTALSHAMEDQVLAGLEQPLVIASFQRERFYRQEAHRYRRIADRTQHVYVLAAPESEFSNSSEYYETIAFPASDALSQEWHLVVIGKQYASCLICREQERPLHGSGASRDWPTMDQVRRFEGIWTFDRQVSETAAQRILERVLHYRPELADKVAAARKLLTHNLPDHFLSHPSPFADRLVTYLQAGQYKLLKAYRSIADQERRERLVNSITAAIRQSLHLDDILHVAVQELGQALGACRCLIYRCRSQDITAQIQYEYLGANQISLVGQEWPLQTNALFQRAVQSQESVYLETLSPEQSDLSPDLHALAQAWQIQRWLLVPILHQGHLLGMIELHHCSQRHSPWQDGDLALVDAIATQVGIALIQSEAYAHLEDLNQQLEALERTRSNLIAITGHELRTPLSTIQICLESLASEPDMPAELQQVMLSTALTDAERLRGLVQDFLTLSRLESGRVEWNLEPLPLAECVDLVLSGVQIRRSAESIPKITTHLSPDLPLLQADGEWLVEVLAKLLDNACKFTQPEGEVTIAARYQNEGMLEILVGDTGRGIEPDRLEVIFERFYQEEGALRRTAGGTGLGLAICRQIVTRLGGTIWAESAGRDQGSIFHFTIPIAQDSSPASDRTSPSSLRKY